MRLNNSFNPQQNLQLQQQAKPKSANANAQTVQNVDTKPTAEGCSLPGTPGGGGGGGFNPPGGWGGGGGNRPGWIPGWIGANGGWFGWNGKGVGVGVSPKWGSMGTGGAPKMQYYGIGVTFTLFNETAHNDPYYDLHHPNISQSDLDFRNELKSTMSDNKPNVANKNPNLTNNSVKTGLEAKPQTQSKMNFLS